MRGVWRYLVGGCLLLAGCNARLSGVVYLDSNNNGLADPDEPRMANIQVKALDDKNSLVGMAGTDAKGAFVVGIPQPGSYCVQVDPGSLHPASGLRVAAVGKAAAPRDSSAGPPPADAVCDETTSLHLEINIPLRRNYAAALAAYPAPAKRTYAPGETFTIRLPHPTECAIQPLYLPDTVALAPVAKPQPIGFDPSLNQVLFLATGGPKTATGDEGELEGQELKLKIREDAPPGAFDVTLHPVARCPGGTEVELPVIEWTVKSPPPSQ